MVDKNKIKLGSVQETLLLPLWGRVIETQKKKPLLVDDKAVSIINSIPYDFTTISKNLPLYLLIFFLFNITATTLYAQKQKHSNLFIDFGLSQGEILKTNEYVKGKNMYGLPISDYSSADIRVGWQTLGIKQWQQELLLPYYGIGLHLSYFNTEDYFGYPNSLYFFFGGSFLKKTIHSFNYEYSFGMSDDWRPYDKEKNPFNVAISSSQNAYVDLRLYYSRLLFKRIEVQAGIRATHFSNGSTSYPNMGLNIISPFVNMRYPLTQREIPSYSKIEQHKSKEEINILISTGRKVVNKIQVPYSIYAGLMNLSLEYLWSPKSIWKYGLGLDMGFDENRNIKVDGNRMRKAPVKEQFFMGNTILGQFRANNLAVQADVGLELFVKGYNKFSQRLYQQIGLRYYVRRKLIIGVGIKARNFSQADYIEWSIGYRIN